MNHCCRRNEELVNQMNQDALLMYLLCLGVSVWVLKHFDPHKPCFNKIMLRIGVPQNGLWELVVF